MSRRRPPPADQPAQPSARQSAQSSARQSARPSSEPVHDSAELVADPDRPRSWTLYVEGTPQSHVDLADPTHLEFEYVRWLGHIVDLSDASAGPLNVLHLGGGAWTLARYVAATRPGSRQRVVELDAALIDLVRHRLPSAGTGIRVRVGDAREVLTGLSADSVDLVVVDVFAGARIPAHLTSVEFVRQAARVLRPGGSYAANLADGAPLSFARSQAATLASVFGAGVDGAEAGESVSADENRGGTALIGPPQVLRGRRFGNLVLVAGQVALGWRELARRTAADPFPARVMAGDELTRFIAGAKVVTDATAGPSPLPPTGLMSV